MAFLEPCSPEVSKPTTMSYNIHPRLRKLLKGQLPVLLQMCQLWSVLAALAHGEDSRAASWQFPELPYVQRFQLLGDDYVDP